MGRSKVELPPGITRRDYQRWLESQKSLGAAHAAAFPGPLRDAMAPETTEALGFKLQPVTSVHLVALQRLNSPLLRAIALLRQNAGKPAKELKRIAERMDGGAAEEIIATFFVFTLGADELAGLLAEGTGAVTAEALRAVGTKVPAHQVQALAFASGAHFAKSYATVVAYEQEHADGSFPSAPARPATASAGA